MTEIWKDIEGLEGLYQVSTKGRVRRISAGQRTYKFRLCKTNKNNAGYLYVVLRKKLYLVHRLVAKAFIDNPNNLSDVDHIDGNKENNDVLNLQWLSHRDNIIKYYESTRLDDYTPIEERTYNNYYNKYYKHVERYYYYDNKRFKTYYELADYLNINANQAKYFCKKHNIKKRA